MHGSGYSAALIAELLAELKAAGHYDSILAEAAAAGRWTDGAKIARVRSCRSDLN
jgi:protein-L-isoaspartate O-methyltransferase